LLLSLTLFEVAHEGATEIKKEIAAKTKNNFFMLRFLKLLV